MAMHGSPASSQTSGWYSWYVVSVLMLAQTVSFIDRMIMGLLVGPIRSSFDISDTQFSLLAGLAFGVFYAIMGLPLAVIADRKSRRGLIAAGISLWSAMTAACGLANGFWSLFFARMGVGIGEASLSPAAYSLIADYFNRSTLARALSVYGIGIAIGSGLAYILGGQVVNLVESLGEIRVPLIGTMQGWQLTFVMVGLPGLLIAALMMTVREPKRKGDATGASADTHWFREIMAYVGSHKRAFLTHIFGTSIYIIVVYSLNIWGPSYLIRTFSMGRGEAGLIMGTILLAGATAGLLAGGTWADRWLSKGRNDAYSQVIMRSALMGLPFILLLGFDISLPVALASLLLAFFFTSFQGGISAGTLQLMVPNRLRGRATALYFMTANLLGVGLGPTVVAFCTDFVFGNDAAIGKSIALTAAMLLPLGVLIIRSGLKQVETTIEGNHS